MADRCEVAPGSGIVVRSGGLAALLSPGDSPRSAQILELIRANSGDWKTLVRVVARKVAIAGFVDMPAIGLLRCGLETTDVFLFGAVSVSLPMREGTVTFMGTDTSTWVERQTGPVISPAELTALDAGPFLVGTDLVEGVVVGSGIRLSAEAQQSLASVFGHAGNPPQPETEAVSADEAAVLPVAPADTVVPTVSADGAGFTDAACMESPAPTDVHHEEPTVAPTGNAKSAPPPELDTVISRPVSNGSDAGHTVAVNPGSRYRPPARPEQRMTSDRPGFVRGIGCTNGHPNRPSDAACRTCNELIDQDFGYVTGRRPAIGWIEIDDGTSIELSQPCIIGHLPPTDHTISGELARPIPLDDDNHHISGRHVEIQLSGWDVRAVDCGSTNGTRYRRSGSMRSSPLKAGEIQPLSHGDQLLLGKRILTFLEQLE